MTRDDTIDTAAEFEAALANTVEAAIHGGLDVRGAWEFETAGSTHYWEINLVELARDEGDESRD